MKTVIEMAREAGIPVGITGGNPSAVQIEHFAELVRADERENGQKWREAEAYAVPMTPEGVKSSQERWRGFNQGYKQAIKGCVDLLMVQHEAAKGQHNYWHVAANLIEAEYGVHSDD